MISTELYQLEQAQKYLSVGKISECSNWISVHEVLGSPLHSCYVGFVFQCDLCFFTVICVTWRVCPQEHNFLVVDSTPAVETYNLA